MAARVYKICDERSWRDSARDGVLPISADDVRDGYVHLSSASQVRGSCARHFAGRSDLWLLEVDTAALPVGALRWETSRGGQAFPHLYGELRRTAIVRADPITPIAGGFEMPPWCPTTDADETQPAAGGIDSARTPEPPAKP